MKFNKIISVCSIKDAQVWMIAAQQIIKYLKSEKYEVIVPDSEVDLFKRISPQDYTVVKESQYVEGLKDLLTKKYQ